MNLKDNFNIVSSFRSLAVAMKCAQFEYILGVSKKRLVGVLPPRDKHTFRLREE